jgi:hypothetical protein
MLGIGIAGCKPHRLPLFKECAQEHLMPKTQEDALEQSTIDAHWNNPYDEKAEKFYLENYL